MVERGVELEARGADHRVAVILKSEESNYVITMR